MAKSKYDGPSLFFNENPNLLLIKILIAQIVLKLFSVDVYIGIPKLRMFYLNQSQVELGGKLSRPLSILQQKPNEYKEETHGDELFKWFSQRTKLSWHKGKLVIYSMIYE